MQFCYNVPTEIHLRLTGQNYVSNSSGRTYLETPDTTNRLGVLPMHIIFRNNRNMSYNYLSPSYFHSTSPSLVNCEIVSSQRANLSDWHLVFVSPRLEMRSPQGVTTIDGSQLTWRDTTLRLSTLACSRYAWTWDSFSTNIEIELNLMILTGN